MPDLLRWAINGYKLPIDRPRLLYIFTSRWPAGTTTPTRQEFDRLLKGEIKWSVDNGAVVFMA